MPRERFWRNGVRFWENFETQLLLDASCHNKWWWRLERVCLSTFPNTRNWNLNGKYGGNEEFGLVGKVWIKNGNSPSLLQWKGLDSVRIRRMVYSGDLALTSIIVGYSACCVVIDRHFHLIVYDKFYTCTHVNTSLIIYKYFLRVQLYNFFKKIFSFVHQFGLTIRIREYKLTDIIFELNGF